MWRISWIALPAERGLGGEVYATGGYKICLGHFLLLSWFYGIILRKGEETTQGDREES